MDVRRIGRATMAAVLIVSASLASAGSASAVPGNGAQVVKTNVCEPWPFNTDVTACYDTRLVINGTDTPSSNGSTTYHYRYHITLSGPGCSQDLQGQESAHILYKQGEPHEQGFTARNTNVFDCGGEAASCTFSQHFHYANGEYQPGWYEDICTEP